MKPARIVTRWSPILLNKQYVSLCGEDQFGDAWVSTTLAELDVEARLRHALVHGIDALTKVTPPRVLHVLAGIGVLIFAGTGVVTMALGDAYLGYYALAEHPQHAQEWGIVVVEFGVGMTVATVMLSLFIAFASHTRKLGDKDW